jgi:hypothetical protein
MIVTMIRMKVFAEERKEFTQALASLLRIRTR